MRIYIHGVCLLYLALQIADSTALWWAVGRVPFFTDTKRICRRARRLKGPQQYRMCRKEQKMVQEIVVGAQMGMKECQHQLRYHRWNCTTVKKSLGKMLLRDTRESAFVQSITASSVAHHITRLCTSGKLLTCSCRHPVILDDKQNSTTNVYLKHGCEDNIDFGIQKSREFMDAEENRYQDIRSQVLFHNNQVGRLTITNSMSTKCKCHGLSGSCALKTCYRKMSDFRLVGEKLSIKFEQAKEILTFNDNSPFLPRTNSLQRRSARQDDLIFTDESPDFCTRTNRRRQGVLSPKGRLCNVTEGSKGDCAHLCCDRGYREIVKQEQYNCNCSFKWCCEVNCDVCKTTTVEHRCK